jgi:exonuclease SbcD
VRAAQLIASTQSEMSRDYDDMVREVIANLTEGFTPGAVNVAMAHLTVTGGTFGGGERAAQSIFDYNVPASAFPADAHYVALGHLHRRQTLAAPCPVVYSEAPFALDFGEQDNTNVVCLVQATPSTPPRSPTFPSPRAGGCGPCTGPSPNSLRAPTNSGTTFSASTSGNPWTWDFSSTQSTTAASGGFRYRPTTS